MLKDIEKIILLDYKYVLADEKDWKMPTKTWNTLKKFKSQGWTLGIVSSSPYRQLGLNFGDKVSEFDFIVSHNGARIDFDGQTIEHKIPLGEIDQIFDLDNYITSFSIGEMMYMDDKDKLEEYAKKYKFKNYKVVDEITEDVLATRLIFETERDRNAKFDDIYKKFNGNFNVTKAGELWILLTTKFATRLNALKEHLIDKEIVYVGGELPDIEVFQSKIFNMKRICPSDALQELKDLADVILEDNHNDGIKFDIKTI